VAVTPIGVGSTVSGLGLSVTGDWVTSDGFVLAVVLGVDEVVEALGLALAEGAEGEVVEVLAAEVVAAVVGFSVAVCCSLRVVWEALVVGVGDDDRADATGVVV
jgi:hypothetical protein